MGSWLAQVLSTPYAHDVPNWFSLLFSLAVWPLFLFWWHRRSVGSVPGLEIRFTPGTIWIGSDPVHGNNPAYPAVTIQFQNHTGSVVYISGPRIRKYTKHYPVTAAAGRDVASDLYHLKFPDPAGVFHLREVTLQTKESVMSSMPAGDTAPPPEFFAFRRNGLLRRILPHKYFILDYTAMVGTTRYSVAMKF